MKKTFEAWKADVNHHIDSKVGLSSDDLPDYDYRGAYNRGDSPAKVAVAAIKAARSF